MKNALISVSDETMERATAYIEAGNTLGAQKAILDDLAGQIADGIAAERVCVLCGSPRSRYWIWRLGKESPVCKACDQAEIVGYFNALAGVTRPDRRAPRRERYG